jgi:hypothetical protein
MIACAEHWWEGSPCGQPQLGLEEVRQAQVMQEPAIEAQVDIQPAACNIVRLRQLSLEPKQLEADLAVLDCGHVERASGLVAVKGRLEVFSPRRRASLGRLTGAAGAS